MRPLAMSEKEFATQLANIVLDTPSRDPDDDLSVMSRQFLHSQERVVELERLLATRDSRIPTHHRDIDARDPERYPASDAEHDPSNDPVGEHLRLAIKRLRFAYVYADPRAPDQMSLAWRGDIGALLGDHIRLKAYSQLLDEQNKRHLAHIASIDTECAEWRAKAEQLQNQLASFEAWEKLGEALSDDQQ